MKQREIQLNKLLETLEQKIVQNHPTLTTTHNSENNNKTSVINHHSNVEETSYENKERYTTLQNNFSESQNIHTLDVVKLIEHLKQEIKDLFNQQRKSVTTTQTQTLLSRDNSAQSKVPSASKMRFQNSSNSTLRHMSSRPQISKESTTMTTLITTNKLSTLSQTQPSKEDENFASQEDELSPQHNFALVCFHCFFSFCCVSSFVSNEEMCFHFKA